MELHAAKGRESAVRRAERARAARHRHGSRAHRAKRGAAKLAILIQFTHSLPQQQLDPAHEVVLGRRQHIPQLPLDRPHAVEVPLLRADGQRLEEVEQRVRQVGRLPGTARREVAACTGDQSIYRPQWMLTARECREIADARVLGTAVEA